MHKLSLQKIKTRLEEAAKVADPFKNTEKVNMKTSTKKSGTTEPKATADKFKPTSKAVKGPALKKFKVKQAANSGPEKAPSSGKISAKGNGSAKPKEVSEPKMAAKSKTTTPLGSAEGFSMDLSNLGVKWAKSRELSQTEKTDLEGTGIMSDKLKKIKFSVSMPKIDYGIVPVEKTLVKTSQSPKFHEVKNVKLVKEGLVNGQVAIRLPNNIYTFDVMTTKELKSICENYDNIGQDIEVVFKPMVRKFYLRSDIKKALAEAVHYNMNSMHALYTEKLSESKKAVKKAITESHSDFFVSEKESFVVETFKEVLKQGYNFYKGLYESQLRPYDVVVRAQTAAGKERFKIVTRALSEAHAAYNAFNEVLSTVGVSTVFENAFVGATKFVFEDVQGILSKSLKFDIDTLGFKDAELKTKTTSSGPVKKPTVGKIKMVTKRPAGVDAAPKRAKGGEKETSARSDMGKDKRSMTVRAAPAKPKDKGIRYPE